MGCEVEIIMQIKEALNPMVSIKKNHHMKVTEKANMVWGAKIDEQGEV